MSSHVSHLLQPCHGAHVIILRCRGTEPHLYRKGLGRTQRVGSVVFSADRAPERPAVYTPGCNAVTVLMSTPGFVYLDGKCICRQALSSLWDLQPHMGGLCNAVLRGAEMLDPPPLHLQGRKPKPAASSCLKIPPDEAVSRARDTSFSQLWRLEVGQPGVTGLVIMSPLLVVCGPHLLLWPAILLE